MNFAAKTVVLGALLTLFVSGSFACVTNPPYCRTSQAGVTFTAHPTYLAVDNESGQTLTSFELTGACGDIQQSGLAVTTGNVQYFSISGCDFTSNIAVASVNLQAVRHAAAHGPSFPPPDPWDGKVAHGPSFPPDPWGGVQGAPPPTCNPCQWDS